MRASKNDEFLEGGKARQRKSLSPPDPQLTIVKIDNIQINNFDLSELMNEYNKEVLVPKAKEEERLGLEKRTTSKKVLKQLEKVKI